jgi:hypothetical protein
MSCWHDGPVPINPSTTEFVLNGLCQWSDGPSMLGWAKLVMLWPNLFTPAQMIRYDVELNDGLKFGQIGPD